MNLSTIKCPKDRKPLPQPIYVSKPFNMMRDVDFFLRLHRHLPDKICGGLPFGNCFYRKDGKPINVGNDYVSELQKNPRFRKKEKEIEKAVKKGKKLYFGDVLNKEEALIRAMKETKLK